MPPTYNDHNPKKLNTGRLNILLSNGRFPVSLDLARQLHHAGHRVFTVDPMEFHICKFSMAVKRSWQTPAPFEDPEGYIEAVKKVIRKADIDMIIPIHEELFYLAESREPEITERLFAGPFLELYQMHNKWEFSETLGRYGLDRPEASLCSTREDVEKLDKSREWALKPVLGRSSTGVHHLKFNEPIDWDNIPLSPENPHIAQEWLKGNRYCTYGVFRSGNVQAFVTYPVLETIDGSSAVYFQATEHEKIKDYVMKLAKELRLTGQFAFDFIETGHRIVAIECNPRATSGIHLWSRTPKLAVAITDTSCSLEELAARPGVARQTAPGMFMWEHKRANARRYFQHMSRLLCTRDVIWSGRDFITVLMQPFLLASYYRIAHDMGGIPLAEMFQSQLLWTPGMFGESKRLELEGKQVGKLVKEWVPKV
ncbi:hypothetical protein NA57DRAFT_37871 [Rhizodiscina lignyota]|uniref:ATP-grasp domain-containing protein n=1 Tax=Rhizodiscina lignyota TaxID=1504668 RepID=A0A9P4M9G1_9PEZI|nr:hypothetical protein NA57DRAFT_37871 [Rhizodiscina lignyota]